MALVTQKISNHHLFPDVEREVEVIGFLVDDQSKTIQLFAKLKYTQNHIDITSSLNSDFSNWAITNEYFIEVRDENLELIQHPDWRVGDSDFNKYLKSPAYDYFFDLAFKRGVNIIKALESYIVFDDKKGAFDI